MESSQHAFQSPRFQSIPRSIIQLVGLLQSKCERHNYCTLSATQPIDFAAWKSKIITKNLVDSVSKSYEDLSAKEYDLDKVFNDVFSKDSKAID